MLPTFLTLCALAVIAMVLRFVQPSLLYGVRRFLREVRTNKATLDWEAGRSVANREFVAALTRDSHPETGDVSVGAARRRANKLRELYRILDLRKPLPDGVARQDSPTVCVIELADLIRNLAQHIKPSLENYRPVVPSGSLLKYVGQKVRLAEGVGGDLTDQDVGIWYIENPITIEQVIEMLIAVVEGVCFRLQAEEDAATRPRQEYSTLDRLVNLERKLRGMIRAGHLAKYSEERIKGVLNSREYHECTKLMQNARVNGGINVDILDYVYFRQLEKLILGDWDLFAAILLDRLWFTTHMERVIWARNELAHSRELSRAQDEAVRRSCEEISERVGRTLGW